jgi:hypothetical protein
MHASMKPTIDVSSRVAIFLDDKVDACGAQPKALALGLH